MLAVCAGCTSVSRSARDSRPSFAACLRRRGTGAAGAGKRGRRSDPPRSDRAAIELRGWLELPWDDAPALVVTGMNEGMVPASGGSDLFLPDTLRRRLKLDDPPGVTLAMRMRLAYSRRRAPSCGSSQAAARPTAIRSSPLVAGMRRRGTPPTDANASRPAPAEAAHPAGRRHPAWAAGQFAAPGSAAAAGKCWQTFVANRHRVPRLYRLPLSLLSAPSAAAGDVGRFGRGVGRRRVRQSAARRAPRFRPRPGGG